MSHNQSMMMDSGRRHLQRLVCGQDRRAQRPSMPPDWLQLCKPEPCCDEPQTFNDGYRGNQTLPMISPSHSHQHTAHNCNLLLWVWAKLRETDSLSLPLFCQPSKVTTVPWEMCHLSGERITFVPGLHTCPLLFRIARKLLLFLLLRSGQGQQCHTYRHPQVETSFRHVF